MISKVEPPLRHILNWDRDKTAFCADVAGRFAPLKILLKTKNEPERLKKWLAHHAGIAGIENLIIFDHASTDPTVLAIYAEQEARFPIITFAGFHNNVHCVEYYPELYAALRTSCRHFCFLDTDEYLTMYDGADRFESNESIIEFLARHSETKVFPATWLHGLEGYPNHFKLQKRIWPLNEGLQWGKPVISTALDISGIILHNTQMKSAMTIGNLRTNLFVLHRNKNAPAERIRVNLTKLISYGVIAPGDGIDEALAADNESLKVGRNFIKEIKQLSAIDEMLPPTQPSIEALTDGTILWSKEWQRIEMQTFLNEPAEYSSRLFS